MLINMHTPSQNHGGSPPPLDALFPAKQYRWWDWSKDVPIFMRVPDHLPIC